MMTLLDFKKESGLTFSQLEDKTGVPRSILHRICHGPYSGLRLEYATRIVDFTGGKIGYSDLLPQEATA